MASLSFTAVTDANTSLLISAQGFVDWLRVSQTKKRITARTGGSTIALSGDNAGNGPSALTISWADGKATLSGSNGDYRYTDVSASTTGNTFSFPANQTTRTAKIWCNIYSSTAAQNMVITATLSDGSAGPVVDNTSIAIAAGGVTRVLITVTYQAGSDNATLTVNFKCSNTTDGSSGVIAYAAGWVGPADPVGAPNSKVLRRTLGAAASGR